MNLSRREKGLITLLIVVAVFGTYIFYLLIPAIDQYRESKKLLDTQNKLLNELKLLQGNQQFLQDEQDITHEWNNLDHIIPSEFKMPDIYNQLMRIKNDAKVNYSTLTFDTPEMMPDNQNYGAKSLSRMTIHISLTGSYGNVKNYLKLLYNQTREYTISDLSLAAEGKNLRATLTAATYALTWQNNTTKNKDTVDHLPPKGDNNGN